MKFIKCQISNLIFQNSLCFIPQQNKITSNLLTKQINKEDNQHHHHHHNPASSLPLSSTSSSDSSSCSSPRDSLIFQPTVNIIEEINEFSTELPLSDDETSNDSTIQKSPQSSSSTSLSNTTISTQTTRMDPQINNNNSIISNNVSNNSKTNNESNNKTDNDSNQLEIPESLILHFTSMTDPAKKGFEKTFLD